VYFCSETCDDNSVNGDKTIEAIVLIGDPVLNCINETEIYWEVAQKSYQTIVSTGLSIDQSALGDAMSLAGNVIGSVLPALLDISKTVPFIGPVVAVSLQVYSLMKHFMQNKTDLENLVSRMTDSLVWLKQSGPMINSLPKDGQSTLEQHVKELVLAIGKIKDMVENWNKRFVGVKLLCTESDKSNISTLSARIERARNDISLHATGLLFEIHINFRSSNSNKSDMKAIQDAFKDAFVSFEVDIKTHLNRFVKGSRNWMHEVRLSDDI